MKFLGAAWTVKPQVPRELETICLKSMSKESAGRYESCQELADDLLRWLLGEPIRAHQTSVVERFARWCWREPVVAGLAAGVAAAKLPGLAASLVLWRQAEAQRGRAVRAAHAAGGWRDGESRRET